MPSDPSKPELPEKATPGESTPAILPKVNVTQTGGGDDGWEIDINIKIRPKTQQGGGLGGFPTHTCVSCGSCPNQHSCATCGDSCPVCHTGATLCNQQTCGNTCVTCAICQITPQITPHIF